MNRLQTLAADQIARHGRDRYPTEQQQLLKLVSEVGELADAWLKWGSANSAFETELCDVALSLGALANKTRHDLDLSVETLVNRDKRDFS
jgi:NTP pyrophosphatase (non-canonical NTP hydrolase)